MTQLRLLFLAMVALIVFAGLGQARPHESERIRDVVYGHKFGLALTLDVVKPSKPNGAGVIFMVSGGFVSDLSKVEAGFFGPARYMPLLERGYTVFLVSHGGQPKFTVSEIVADIHRSVRFIRVHAKDYGVDPDRLGITGVSSGGFLALMMGTKGTPGDPNAKEAIDRASSRVQAVGCFCPSSDLVDYGKTGQCFLEYEPVKFAWHVFGLEGKSRDEQIKALRELSPIDFITKQTPPTLIIHGDADPLVPYEQSTRFDAKLATHGVPHHLVARKNAGHVWLGIAKEFTVVADWFDKYLLGTEDRKRQWTAFLIRANTDSDALALFGHRDREGGGRAGSNRASDSLGVRPTLSHMITVDEIQAGLTQKEFFLVYMPTVSLADGRCVGAEALTRWIRPTGVVPPSEFIPLIEGTPLSGLLTYWVIETVAKELGDWLLLHEEAHIGINVPPEILGRGGLEYAATKSGLGELWRQIILEVTERGLPDRLGVAALEAASRAGIRVALDDVTLTGVNLAVLSRCTLDVIKIDRSLVSQITPECPCPSWLSGLTALLQSTRMEVIAEGVETESQIAALRSSGISMAQGYYYSLPILAEELKAYYATARGHPSRTVMQPSIAIAPTKDGDGIPEV